MEPEFVDITALPLVADEQWLLQQVNGNGAGKEDNTSWEPRNLAELEDKPPIEPTLGGLGLVYPGKRHVFSGPQESAKTLAAYVIGLQVVREGHTVVLIDFEMGPWDAKTRLRELGCNDDELGRFLYVEPDTPAGAANVAGLVDLEPSLVIVDAVAGAFQLESYDDNARRDVERWAAKWVQPFWRAGIATIVLDHVTKNAETRGNYAIGSERKVGGADVHLGFSVIVPIRRGSHGKYQITNHKDRGGHLKRGKLATFELDSDEQTHRISWEFVTAPMVDEEHEFRPTGLMEKVSRFLEMMSDPQSQRAVEREKFGKTEYVRDALRLLIAEGYVERSEGARGYLHESLNPYREDNDTTASQVRPDRVHFGTHSTASRVPPPIGGTQRDADADDGDALSVTDQIPF